MPRNTGNKTRQIVQKQFGVALRRYLASVGKTQSQFSAEIGITQSTISTWCNGKMMKGYYYSCPPEFVSLVRIVAAGHRKFVIDLLDSCAETFNKEVANESDEIKDC